MSKEDLSNAIKKATDASASWAVTGWPMTFGDRHEQVNNKEAADSSAKTYVNRLEAIAYWARVEQAGAEAAEWGKRALASLEKGDLADCDDSIYYAIFVEKPLNEDAPTWAPVYDICKKVRNGG